MSAPQVFPFPRPAHIVLFGRESGLRSFLSRCGSSLEPASQNKPASSGRLAARNKVFRDLNAIATSLSEGQELILRDYEAEVFPNEDCFLPTYEIVPMARFALASEDSPRLASTSQTHSMTWGLRAMGLTDDYSTYGDGITVAILDTGIDVNHPDLVHGLKSQHLRSFVPLETVEDFDGHGTHCAGTILGNRKSVGGISYGVSPGVTLLAGKVFNQVGRSTDDIILAGIEWAAVAGAKVLSLSFEKKRAPDAEPSRLYQALAARLLERGTLIVAAAGNRKDEEDTNPVSDPAACPSILSVASIDKHGNVAKLCRGATDRKGKVDIAAPGVEVLSSWLGGGFRMLSGTSMATPHVAGAIALHWQARPKDIRVRNGEPCCRGVHSTEGAHSNVWRRKYQSTARCPATRGKLKSSENGNRILRDAYDFVNRD